MRVKPPPVAGGTSLGVRRYRPHQSEIGKREYGMKFIAAALALGLVAAGGMASSPASAQSVYVGPRGGLHINPGPRFHRPVERCRVIVERRRNRFGEMVVRRTRVCRR